ncbi:MAG: hypothetical protein IJB16_01660 [Clostridia bacterium]|nr:hypothetical protein [Clostridia bacterium]
MKKAKTLLALVLAMLIAFGSTVCAFAAQDPAETEDNGTMATADTFGIGSGIKGKIGEADDKDYYTFTASQSGVVTVTLAHDEKNGADPLATYFKVTITDANGEVIDVIKSAGSQKTASIDFSVVSGVYYAVVEGGSVIDTSFEYVLSAKINTTALFENEPNNMVSQATTLKLSKRGDTKLYYGAITEGDVDYYYVKFDAPSLASFGIYNTASKAGNYKASLIKIVDGINGAPQPKVVGSITINAGEEIKDSPTFGVNGGVYYLKVEGVGASTGGYQVRVFAGASNADVEYEYNNDEKYPNTLKIGKSVTGNIFDETDVDVYCFNAPKKNNGYKITFVDYDGKKDVVNGQWIFEITDENGNVIEDKNTVLTSDDAVLAETDVLPEGVYYIKVSVGNVFTGETYKLSVAEKEASKEEDKDKEDDGKITIDEFIKNITSIDWTNFWKNFEQWLPSVNVIGMLSDLFASVIDFLTTFVFAQK